MRLTQNRIAQTTGRQRTPVGASENGAAAVADGLRRQIAEHPRVALGVSVVVGVFAGWWVKR